MNVPDSVSGSSGSLVENREHPESAIPINKQNGMIGNLRINLIELNSIGRILELPRV